jgi:IclR family transcriptional regulator, mhp operon transcriptional activator
MAARGAFGIPDHIPRPEFPRLGEQPPLDHHQTMGAGVGVVGCHTASGITHQNCLCPGVAVLDQPGALVPGSVLPCHVGQPPGLHIRRFLHSLPPDAAAVSLGVKEKPVQVKSIHALARGLQVLQVLQSSQGLGLAALHRQTGIPKASLLRILKTLMEQGFIWQRMLDDAWVPSYSLAELAGRIDREHQLVEVASPILEALTRQIEWPSVLAVPRLSHMEVIETNVTRAYFDQIALGPMGFRVNMLRSASGRAFLAFCPGPVREAVLQTLRRSDRKGDRLAHSADYVATVLAETRNQGFGLRDPDFGGDYDEGRSVVDDGRESIAVAIRLPGDVLGPVPGTLNITWSRKVHRRDRAVALLAAPALRAAAEIAARLARLPVSPGEIPAIGD